MSDQAFESLIEIIGWIGIVEILLAYGLNTYQKIRSDSVVFCLLNLTGGLFLVLYTGHKEAYANTLLNLVWALIALVSLGKSFWQKAAKNV